MSQAAHSSDSSWRALLVGQTETRERTGGAVWVLETVGGATSEAVFVGGGGVGFMVGGMLSVFSSLSAVAVFVGRGGGCSLWLEAC
jgi:hypothetical protein